ncbi:adenine nucleotide alpha hydrolase family protein [Halorussus ruber]|uniref:hypothetical protein n=1 Tax=Halorussus ruber TaxID=1126238 RepID=UPI001FE58063|nr:hypothetical protein [Halorussus ruber]
MRTVLSWSGGKDASYALWKLRESDAEVVELLTNVSAATDRASMHGVPGTSTSDRPRLSACLSDSPNSPRTLPTRSTRRRWPR